MNSTALKNKILELRPRYSENYRQMIETISNKGEKIGSGNIAKFGPIYQTYMYACIIGLRLNKCKKFDPQEKTTTFASMFHWQPASIRDYITMMLFNRAEEFGYQWMDIENANDEIVTKFIGMFIRQMEGYANAGFEYLSEKWEKQRVLFESPTIFVDILRELDNNK